MLKSMTGYGKGSVVSGAGRITVEIRSVNHRYGEVSVRMPRQLLAYEAEVRRSVGERLKRGKVEVHIQLEGVGGAAGLPSVNLPLARAYYEALVNLREALGLADPVTLAMVAGQRDVVGAGDGESDEELREHLLQSVCGAVEGLEQMRRREGETLREDLLNRLYTVRGLVAGIAGRAPEAVTTAAGRLRERVAQLMGDCSVDEARLAQEIALLADRADITEELVRFDSHLQQFSEALQRPEPVGRKLDFLLQELNRETNTVGSKACDAGIATLVVELKAELEKIREQVQNIE